MPDYDDDPASPDEPVDPQPEGVRILGADEVTPQHEEQVRGRPAPRRSTTPPPGAQPAARFPLPGGHAPEDMPEPRPTPPPEPTGPIRLPHWTEPPSGEVPQIGFDAGDDDDVWSSGGGPRFRSEGGGGWDDADFGDDPLHDDTTALGALVDLPEVDEDEVFAAEVEARRAPERRTRTRTRAERGSRSERPARPAAAAAGPAYPGDDDFSTSTRSAPRDDLMTRVVTGLVLAGVALICFGIGRAATAVLITVIVTAAGFELYEGFRRSGFQPATLIGLLGCVSIVGVAYNYGERAFGLVTALVVVFSMLWYLARVVNARPMVNIAVTVLGFAYVGVLGGFGGLMLTAPNGVGIVIGLALCAIGYDVAGYLVGSRIGKRRLSPEWSPNKTMEGLLAGMGASVLIGVIVGSILSITPWNSAGDGFMLGLVVAIFAPLGDLCESMLKRDLGLKDFGTMLPGHGGVLDRFDAMLFCLPAVYYLVLALGLS